jgi:hypothetical protein
MPLEGSQLIHVPGLSRSIILVFPDLSYKNSCRCSSDSGLFARPAIVPEWSP